MRRHSAKIRTYIMTSFLILQGYLTDRILRQLWLMSSNLLWYFFYIFYEDTGWYLVFVFLFFKFIEHADDEARLFKRNKDTVPGSPWKDEKSKRVMFIVWGVLAVITVIVNLTPTAYAYSHLRVDGEKISKLEYKYRILSDWVSDRLVSEECSTEEVTARRINYSVSSSSSRYARGSRTVFKEYIRFEGENGSFSTYPLTFEFYKYINQRKEESVPSFTITYYEKSGVVVAVDGYSVMDLKKQNEIK